MTTYDLLSDVAVDLLWIAQQALTAKLPTLWTEHVDAISGERFFHNLKTGESSWEHPADAYYKRMYEELRKAKAARIAAENERTVLKQTWAGVPLGLAFLNPKCASTPSCVATFFPS